MTPASDSPDVNRVPALFAAQAVAGEARTNMLTSHAVDDMRTKAEELLARDDPMRAAILDFATNYELVRRDPHGLRYHGEALARAIEADLGLTRPTPRERRDIDG
jgi:hypothetical protein